MKKFISLPILGLAILAIALVGFSILKKRYFPHYFVKNKLEIRVNEPVIAVYDPFNKMPGNNIRHYALVIKADSDWKIEKNTLSSIAPEVPVILTIEIWGSNILDRIAKGSFDNKFRRLLSETISNRKNVYLRFLPEMEQNDKDYPWTNWGTFYLKAFNRFTQIAEKEMPQANILWGPSGSIGNMEYYPKDQIIDAASITLHKDNKVNDLQNQVRSQLLRMRFLKTPVFILGSPTQKNELSSEKISNIFARFEKEKAQIDFKHELNTNTKHFKRKNEVAIGVYDPENLLVNKEEISVEHIFINFEEIRNGSMIKNLTSILSRGHDVIITIEPNGDRKVLKKIYTGERDALLRRFYMNIPETEHNIYLRFAHEMEIPIDRYAWQKQDPIDYIKAYRHFVKFPDTINPHIKTIWGPAGDKGSLQWWPGGDVVDFISMSVYGLPDKNITDPDKQESFERIYERKKRRLDFFHKPFFITEFGVKGSEEFQQNWLQNAAKVINRDTAIFGVNYFNYQDLPDAWGDIKPPDWRISVKTFENFTRALD